MSQQFPAHIAVIMDGNRRWAKQAGLAANDGHRQGVEALEKLVKHSANLGIQFLTVYALSTENLREREKDEIQGLFALIKDGLQNKLPTLIKEGVKLNFIGNLDSVPTVVATALQTAKTATRFGKNLQLNIAFNYGAREEILVAAAKTRPKNHFEEKDFVSNLYTVGLPDPELIIRTGGQKRLSNFLLWQAAYSELYFTETLWPDFDDKALDVALEDYISRKRNFGA